jgi:hypothetical protein
MKTLYKFLIFSFLLHLLDIPGVMSQVSINTDNSAPDPSAMLDIKSNNKGLLLPRIDFNNRPSSPALGLLIYVTAHGPAGNGFYFFDGTGWTKISTVSYTMGQHIGGGVVFYIDSSGLHGLIACDTDEVGTFPYGCDSDSIPGANGTALGTGQQNTLAIIAACADPSIAARACDTSTYGGFTDWFLPSRDELDSLYVHQAMIGGFNVNDWYWSSSEASTPGAWIVIFSNGIEGWTAKYWSFEVRCIRKF